MRSINETVDALRALEKTLLDNDLEITDKERESLVRSVLRTIVEDEVVTETIEKGVGANV